MVRGHDRKSSAARVKRSALSTPPEFVGDPVAVVIAESRYIAEDGCELAEVEYEDLPPVVDAAFALDPGSPPLFDNLGEPKPRLRQTQAIEAPGVTHIRYVRGAGE